MSALLLETGFIDVGFDDVRELWVFGATTAEAYALLSDDGPTRGLLADLSGADKATALDQLRAIIAAHGRRPVSPSAQRPGSSRPAAPEPRT